MENSARGVYTNNAGAGVKSKKTFRHVPSAPERILDAPELIDDYYLNLIDWGSTNQVAVALGCVVYLWNADSGDIQQLCQTDPNNGDDYVTGVQWGGDGKHIAVGTNDAEVQIWDVSRLKQVRTLRGPGPRRRAAWSHAARHGQQGQHRDDARRSHPRAPHRHAYLALPGGMRAEVGAEWQPARVRR